MKIIKTWADLKEFANTLSEEQLNQKVKVFGENHSETVKSVEIFDEDMIDPSGDGCEPISVYLNDPEYGQDFIDSETVCYKAGTIMITAD